MKKCIVILILLSLSQICLAGQGLYLRINSYLPNTNVKITGSNCVSGYENISVNNTAYLSAQDNISCLVQKSTVTLALLQNDQEIKNYTLTISANGSSLSTDGVYTDNKNNLIVSTLYPHSGVNGTQDWVTISLAHNEDHWLGDMSSAIANKPLNSIILPGSHDTGTYGISDQSEIASDINVTLKFWTQLDAFKIQHLKSWSITQHFDTKTQLESGIRYLDLRLCKSANESFVTCHSLTGDNIQNIFKQISNFLNTSEHSKELVILDFNHLYSISNNDIDQLTKLIKNNFGDKIASARLFSPFNPISRFWDTKKQIIIIMDSDYAIANYPDIYWSQNTISSPYPAKQNSIELQQFMLNALTSRNKQQFFVLQTQETPETQTIIDGFNVFSSDPSSLLKLTTTYKHDIANWLLQPVNQADLRQNGNIIIEDFTNGVDLTELAKTLN